MILKMKIYVNISKLCVRDPHIKATHLREYAHQTRMGLTRHRNNENTLNHTELFNLV